MSIHHATQKKANEAGIELQDSTNIEGGIEVAIGAKRGKEAVTAEYTSELGEAKAVLAAALAVKMLIVEYPGLHVEAETGTLCVGEDDGGLDLSDATAEDIEGWFAAFDDEQRTAASAGDTDDEERESSGSVVPAVYKQRYKERGDPTHCGDWLAIALNKHVHVKNEKGKLITDYDRVEAIAIANGVHADRPKKLTTVTPGWQGRYRMTVRNMLTPIIAEKGFMLIPEGVASEDIEVPAPAEWLAAHVKKDKPVAEAKAKPQGEAGVQKTPGAGKKGAKKTAKA